MTARAKYLPGSAKGAEIQKTGEAWKLLLVRELHHPPELVWQALTNPADLAEWAPFDADRSLDAAGPVKLKTIGAPTSQISECTVTRADAPRLLEYNWGPQNLRWELEPVGSGATRLTLWHSIDQRFIAWGAAGWHICFDVLGYFLDGAPIGRIVAAEAMKFDWQRLVAEYAKQFGIEAPSWPATKSGDKGGVS